uniref:Glutathione peroxidase 1 n=1 Tax=Homo sapiens TaxID=9606 RepID=A0A994J4K6_HUMAN
MCAARLAAAAAAAQSVYAFSARPLAGGEPVSLGSLRGKVLLIENVASLCGTTVRDYTQMNELQRRLGPRGLVVLGFPCNQFGHQENAKNEEILNSLKYSRRFQTIDIEPDIEALLSQGPSCA